MSREGTEAEFELRLPGGNKQASGVIQGYRDNPRSVTYEVRTGEGSEEFIFRDQFYKWGDLVNVEPVLDGASDRISAMVFEGEYEQVCEAASPYPVSVHELEDYAAVVGEKPWLDHFNNEQRSEFEGRYVPFGEIQSDEILVSVEEDRKPGLSSKKELAAKLVEDEDECWEDPLEPSEGRKASAD